MDVLWFLVFFFMLCWEEIFGNLIIFVLVIMRCCCFLVKCIKFCFDLLDSICYDWVYFFVVNYEGIFFKYNFFNWLIKCGRLLCFKCWYVIVIMVRVVVFVGGYNGWEKLCIYIWIFCCYFYCCILGWWIIWFLWKFVMM